MSGFLIADANDDGLPAMNGHRKTTTSVEEAAVMAEETNRQVFALEPVEVDVPFPPVSVVDVRDADLGEWLAVVP